MAPATTKAPKEGNSKKMTTSAPKKPRAYPTYYEMVNEAITALKERTGSSQIAIAKFIEEKQKDLPNNFKKLLLVQLRKLVANGKLVKVKNSFKLPPKTSATNTTAVAAVKKTKSPSTQKPKSTSTTAAAAKKTKSASAKEAAKKPKSTLKSDAAKKSKSASTKAPAATKRKAPAAKVAAKKPKVDGKKAASVTKAKKLKSIKSPVKKVAAKKAKK
ncbi:hypothetical protein Dsin_029781 [Dipteronia sinensis]|uniref:H15 domain-containing protein n=1 Tax=Dipteronia sinensis TaxID=43782 RepID=A0AAD9ZTP9_9ROSI|nr:hypothetical protein Dsin_029781 [Dipteronia sinensis]